jgi:hypothetical protein
VDLEEKFEQIAIARLLGIEHDLDAFGVTAVVAIGCVGYFATGVAHEGL